MRRLRILTVQAAIAVLLLEALLRVYNPLPFRLRGDDIVLPAGFRYTLHNPPGPKLDPVTNHTKNRLGFRGPDRPADFKARLSIVSVGGSTTECFLLSDGKTWTDVMAAELAKGHPNLWVNNAGFDGHSTFGHLVLLRSVLAELKPTVVLFLAGVNDVGADWGYPKDEFDNPPPVRLVHHLANSSEIFNSVLNVVRVWRARQLSFDDRPVDLADYAHFSMTDEEVAEEVLTHQRSRAGYEARLTRLARESRAARIEPVFLTQPTLVGDTVDPETGIDLSTLAEHHLNGRAQWRVLESYNEVMRRVAARDGTLLIDLANQLPKDSRYYYDLVHFSNQGARAVGEIVAVELGAHLALKGYMHREKTQTR